MQKFFKILTSTFSFSIHSIKVFILSILLFSLEVKFISVVKRPSKLLISIWFKSTLSFFSKLLSLYSLSRGSLPRRSLTFELFLIFGYKISNPPRLKYAVAILKSQLSKLLSSSIFSATDFTSLRLFISS